MICSLQDALLTEPVPVDSTRLLVLVGVVLAAVGLGLTPLAIALSRHLCKERVVFFARWGFSRIALAVGLVVVLGLGASFLPQPQDAGWRLVVQLCISSVLLAAASAYALSQGQAMHPEGWRALGFAQPRPLRPLLAASASWCLLLPLVLGLGLLSGPLVKSLGFSDAPQPLLEAFRTLQGLPLALAVLFVVLLQPFFEELLFRGFLQPLCIQNFGDRGGLVVTSVLFAALHCSAGPAPFLPLLALSMILGGSMLRTQSLLASYAVHALHNGLTLYLLLCVPATRELLP